jgi:hypothetical protein
MASINYYVFDRIDENSGSYTAFLGNEAVEVYPLGSETDEELYEGGWAKCGTEGTETFVCSYDDAEYAMRNGQRAAKDWLMVDSRTPLNPAERQEEADYPSIENVWFFND